MEQFRREDEQAVRLATASIEFVDFALLEQLLVLVGCHDPVVRQHELASLDPVLMNGRERLLPLRLRLHLIGPLLITRVPTQLPRDRLSDAAALEVDVALGDGDEAVEVPRLFEAFRLEHHIVVQRALRSSGRALRCGSGFCDRGVVNAREHVVEQIRQELRNFALPVLPALECLDWVHDDVVIVMKMLEMLVVTLTLPLVIMMLMWRMLVVMLLTVMTAWLLMDGCLASGPADWLAGWPSHWLAGWAARVTC